MAEVTQGVKEANFSSANYVDRQEAKRLAGRIWNIGIQLGKGERFLVDPKGRKYAKMNFCQWDETKAAGEGKEGLVIEVMPINHGRRSKKIPPESFHFYITKGGFVEKETVHSPENSEKHEATKEELEDLLMMLGDIKLSSGVWGKLKDQFSSIFPFPRGSR
jgi:hypothetical protein